MERVVSPCPSKERLDITLVPDGSGVHMCGGRVSLSLLKEDKTIMNSVPTVYLSYSPTHSDFICIIPLKNYQALLWDYLPSMAHV